MTNIKTEGGGQYSKKDLIENHAEFLCAMDDYENNLSELYQHVQEHLYQKYDIEVTKKYISHILRTFIF